MTSLIRLEILKLRTTPALYITVGAAFALSLVSAVTNVLLPVKAGDPPVGSRGSVVHVLNQPGAVTSMAMFILGVLIVAGEYRQRTILQTFLAEPRRGRIVLAKLVTTGVLGGVAAAAIYVATVATVVPIYAAKGVHHLPVDVTSLGLGTALSGACYGLLGVAIGALTRNTVAAIIAGLIWIQLIEVGILENAVPSMAKWLPAGAAQGLTAVDRSSHVLPQAVAAIVLVGWAAVLVAAATRLSIRRELR
jgi:ABC-type transport system involved in multi-copper enzyme maturation permease subunit